MTSRTSAFLAAAAILVVVRIVMWMAKRRGNAFFAGDQSEAPDWHPYRLLLASFLTLFAELAFIRWIAVEVRVFAYFKNLALLLCFLGFGLGCAMVKQRSRWFPALEGFLGLLLVIRIPWQGGRLLEGLSQSLGGAGDVGIWSTPEGTNWGYFLSGALLAGCLFLLIVSVFVPLGQVVSREMDRAPSSLRAYSWDLLGSVIGVSAFFLVSRWMLPPSAWMGIVLVGFALLQTNRRDAALVASLLLPALLLLHEPAQPNQEIFWTPYQQIQYTRGHTANGDSWGGEMLVNHTLYQRVVDLSPQFLARHPAWQKDIDNNPYNLPFRFAIPSPSVLVVGSGTGNDVAAALRNGSPTVDAVEIDPAILDLGRREHPEHPYESPRVNVHLGDARSFLKRTSEHYDLILFGLLDSHAQFSDYSNMRIDNFVYTEEAFREAARHLSSNGVIFVKFQVDRPWLGARLVEMLRATLGSSPVVFSADATYSLPSTCFVASAGQRVNEALAADPRLVEFVGKNRRVLSDTVPITTDDWPYLYQRDRRIPRTYYSVSVLVILIAIILYARVRRTDHTHTNFSLFFFGMGAGFLLLETQIISRLALFFGTIWQVNGIVISTLLLALLLANAVVGRAGALSKSWIWAGLVASLAFAYWFPFDRTAAAPAIVGMMAIGIFSIPVLFAGILFSTEFRNVDSPSAALGANILGAVTGGLLENLSLLFGLRALLLVAILLYCVAGFGLWRRKKYAV